MEIHRIQENVIVEKITSAENLVYPFTKTLTQKTFKSHLEGMCEMYAKLGLRASERLLGFKP
jgi:hypothetical protein